MIQLTITVTDPSPPGEAQLIFTSSQLPTPNEIDSLKLSVSGLWKSLEINRPGKFCWSMYPTPRPYLAKQINKHKISDPNSIFFICVWFRIQFWPMRQDGSVGKVLSLLSRCTRKIYLHSYLLRWGHDSTEPPSSWPPVLAQGEESTWKPEWIQRKCF